MEAYIGLGPETGNIVPKAEALQYALDQCGLCKTADADNEKLAEFEEWFFDSYFYLDEVEDEI